MITGKSKPDPFCAATPEILVAALEGALAAVKDLTARRLEAKLSVSHLSCVARELRNLIKVMSVYGV